jgi:hypothetical protein
VLQGEEKKGRGGKEEDVGEEFVIVRDRQQLGSRGMLAELAANDSLSGKDQTDDKEHEYGVKETMTKSECIQLLGYRGQLTG